MPISPKNDRCRGALIGLAIGDALGAAVEFRPPGSFEPVTGYRGGARIDSTRVSGPIFEFYRSWLSEIKTAPLQTYIPWRSSSNAFCRCVSRFVSSSTPGSRMSPLNTPITSETRNNAIRTAPRSVRDRMPYEP